MDALVRALLRKPGAALATELGAFRRAASERADDFRVPIDRAIVGGLVADRVGFAFAAGFHAALCRLVPSLGFDHRAALAVSETGGTHPRAIQTTLRARPGGLVLSGTKSWSTLAAEADTLLIAACRGERPDGRADVVVAKVDSARTGIVIEPMAASAFVPEIHHARLKLDDVKLSHDELLPGDGYADYVKPFRTIEDVHVFGALLGYLVSLVRRRRLEPSLNERLVSLALTAAGLGRLEPAHPATHLALAGLLASVESLVQELDALLRGEDPEAVRWRRDRALFKVAGSAREKRLVAARRWQANP